MQFPESWLREFCNPPMDTAALAQALTMAGLEVEETRAVAPPFSGVVVCQILECTRHPSADRLQVCTVDVGGAAPLEIVCGAPNARAGIRVPCARVGAELPPGEDGKPFLIRVGKLRGVESHGMLCSARELKLSDDHGGLLELADDAPVGADIRSVLQLDDTLFTLKLTPNLAHCLSVYGVARELSALSGVPLSTPVFPAVAVTHAGHLSVRVTAPDLCGRFSGRIVRGIDPRAKTPGWMVDRLARCGQRSVTALVDISNYVMFELGRPSHIFDLDKLHGALDVRWARAGETLKLLNGTTVSLDETVGVIADEMQVESLAGIMGGDATAVSNETRNVYIEAAFWHPKSIAGRSRRFNFSTDAGHRFERGVDPGHTVEHIERITALVLSICGGQAGPVDDLQPNMPVVRPVSVRVARAAKVIGMPITQAQCAAALQALGFSVEEGDGAVTVTPPSWRFDLTIEEDLIEEIARMVGYDTLPHSPPIGPITPRSMPEAQRSAFAVRRLMAARGYQETINFSFVDERWERELAGNPNPIKLLNPIASHMGVMRSSLIGSLLQAAKFNLDRKMARLRVFEIGRVFLRDASVIGPDTAVQGFDQPMRLTALAYGPADAVQWGRAPTGVDFYDVKGDVEAMLAPRQVQFEPTTHSALHPGRCARIVLDGREVGFVGELHPRWRQAYGFAQAPVVFELALNAVLERVLPRPVPVPRQQDIERDIAVIVREGVTYDAVCAAVWAAAPASVLRTVTLFDVYRPTPGGPSSAALASGEKSLALQLVFNAVGAALDDQQVEAAVATIVAGLASDVGARLRG